MSTKELVISALQEQLDYAKYEIEWDNPVIPYLDDLKQDLSKVYKDLMAIGSYQHWNGTEKKEEQ